MLMSQLILFCVEGKKGRQKLKGLKKKKKRKKKKRKMKENPEKKGRKKNGRGKEVFLSQDLNSGPAACYPSMRTE